eukprot:5204346-Prorocentrum_lima.AAC.1
MALLLARAWRVRALRKGVVVDSPPVANDGLMTGTLRLLSFFRGFHLSRQSSRVPENLDDEIKKSHE